MKTHITTEELASMLGLKPNTFRAALCRNGHYYGIRPVKLPNRRLMWPLADVRKLMDADTE